MLSKRWPIPAAALVLLVVAACAPTPQAAKPAAPAKEAAPAAPAAKYGGTFRFTGIQPPAQLDPHKFRGIGISTCCGHIYEPLVSFEYAPDVNPGELRVVPALAESWRLLDDRTYVFNLRKDVKWHDGEPFTAADVVFSYERLKDPKNAFEDRGLVEQISKLEAPDDFTVRMTTNEPYAPLLRNLASYYNPMIPKHVFDRGGDLRNKAIGTGPFRQISYDRESLMATEKNPYYWRKGQPYLDGVETLYGLDNPARLAAFIAKKIDLHAVVTKPEFDSIKERVPDAQLEVMPTMFNNVLWMQQSKPPFSDIRVRRAIHLAMDRQEFISTLTQGTGFLNPPGVAAARGKWALPESEFANLPGWRQPKDQDLAEAKRLMAEAGYPAGFKTTLITKSEGVTFTKMIPLAQRQLVRFGLDVDMQLIDAAVFTKKMLSGEFEMMLYQMEVTSSDPDAAFLYYETGARVNTHGAGDPKLDELIRLQRRTMNDEARMKIGYDIQRQILEKVYSVPLIDFGNHIITQSYVRGFRNYNLGVNPWVSAGYFIWFDK